MSEEGETEEEREERERKEAEERERKRREASGFQNANSQLRKLQEDPNSGL